MNLFLDDERLPEEVNWNIISVDTEGHQLVLSGFYAEYNWTIARSYNDFVDAVEKHGVPKVISLDHDLADEHYQALRNDIRMHVVDYGNFKEKTGYQCLQFLINKCFDENESLPNVLIHTMNPVGRDKMLSLIRCAHKFKQKPKNTND